MYYLSKKIVKNFEFYMFFYFYVIIYNVSYYVYNNPRICNKL